MWEEKFVFYNAKKCNAYFVCLALEKFKTSFYYQLDLKGYFYGLNKIACWVKTRKIEDTQYAYDHEPTLS